MKRKEFDLSCFRCKHSLDDDMTSEVIYCNFDNDYPPKKEEVEEWKREHSIPRNGWCLDFLTKNNKRIVL